MSENQKSNAADRLDRYIDGLLNPDERDQFEDELLVNEALSTSLELQTQVDDALCRVFQPPPLAAQNLLSSIPNEESTIPNIETTVQTSTPIWKWALAACLIGAAAFLWYRNLPHLPEDIRHEYHSPGLATIYHDSVDQGFVPKWLCDNDREFAETFLDRQGQALVLKPLPSGSRMVGLAYLGGFSSKTTTLMCYVDEQPVMVLVDRISADMTGGQIEQTDPGLNVFRRVVEMLVIYEVTPFPEPRITEYLIPVSELPPLTK